MLVKGMILFLFLKIVQSFFLFHPGRRWIVGGSFRNVSISGIDEPVSGIAFYFNGEWGSYGRGTFNGEVHCIEVDSMFSIYIGGSFTHMYDKEGDLLDTGPVAMWKYDPFDLSQQDWQAIWTGLPVTFEANPLTGNGPAVYDLSTDCWNSPKIGGLACDVYIGGEFLVKDLGEGSNVIGFVPPDCHCTLNLFKWDSNEEKFDFFSPPSDTWNYDYFHGKILAVHKKDHEYWALSTTESDKKLWIGGAYPFGFGMVSLYENSDEGASENMYYRAAKNIDWRVNDILYVKRAADEIWVGGFFNFTSGDQYIQNFANFNHKCFAGDAKHEWEQIDDCWEAWEASEKDIKREWPVLSESSIGITSISRDGNDKFVAGWDSMIMNEDYLGVYKMKKGKKKFSSPSENNDCFEDQIDRKTYIKKIDVCTNNDVGCEGGSVVMVGGGGFLKYYDNGDEELKNIGDTERPFGTGDVFNVVITRYMLSGEMCKICVWIIFLCVSLLWI